MLAVGSDAPDFKLDSQFDTEYTLSQFKGSKNVMLFFYPLDWTYTWSKEIPKIESMIDRFNEVDTQVLGVSIDSKHSHKTGLSLSVEYLIRSFRISIQKVPWLFLTIII